MTEAHETERTVEIKHSKWILGGCCHKDCDWDFDFDLDFEVTTFHQLRSLSVIIDHIRENPGHEVNVVLSVNLKGLPMEGDIGVHRFGIGMRQERHKQGISQTDLSDMINMPRQRISAYERGVKRPGPNNMARISAALGKTIKELSGTGSAP